MELGKSRESIISRIEGGHGPMPHKHTESEKRERERERERAPETGMERIRDG